MSLRILILLAGSMFLFACDSQHHDHAQSAGASAASVTSSGGSMAPGCSMEGCGMMRKTETATTRPAQTTQPAAARATYICPMHPEVTSDRPAKCPKCGMALVKATDGNGHMDHSGHMH